MLDRARVRDIFSEALSLPAEARAAYLDRACGGDQALRAEVQSLLDAAAKRPEFLASPTAGGTDAPSERPGERIGPYKILEEIGQGGFGAVYMAEQESPVRRRVALKIIKLGMDTKAVIARFEAERQALAMMEHDHIARVFDAGATESGRPYFVMELVPGDPITEYADRANLTIQERLELFVQVCQAVQHAHSKGVIHRDLKPGNILVTTQDGRPHAKVIDFGIAKAISQRLTEKTMFTEFRQFVGTPQYMSPEQAGGGTDVDTRSDVYSLGALLYELLTGVTPFDAKTLREAAYEEVFRIIREEDPAPPSTRCSRAAGAESVAALRRAKPERLSALLAGDLDWIVMKALEKDRGRRYETAAALAEDISRHLEGRAVQAAPPSMGYRARKFARRNRGLVIGGSAVVAALLLGVIGTGLALLDAGRARTRAETQARRAEAAEADALRGKSEAEYEGYLANIESAYGALRFNDVMGLGKRLDACVPDRRGWEWGYLNATRDASLMILKHPPRELANLVYAYYSRDGSRILSRSGDGTVWIWDAATGAEIRTLTGPEKIQSDVDMSPSGELVLAAALDSKIWVWDAKSGDVVAKLVGHKKQISTAAFLDDNRIVSTSEDGTARIWDARSGTELRVMRHEGAIRHASLSPDMRSLATGSMDQTVRVWRIDEDVAPIVMRGHTGVISRVRWSGDSGRLVSASGDATVRVWDAHTGEQLAMYRHDGRASSAEWSPDGTRIVSFSTQGDPCVWNATNGELLFTLSGHTNGTLNASFSDDGKWILTSSRDTTVRLWDANTGAQWSCLRGHTESPWGARFSPDGSRIVTSGDTTVRVWAVARDGEQSIIPAPLADCAAIALSPDERTVVDVGKGRFRLIDLASGQEGRPFEARGFFGICGISPDGSKVALSLPDNAVGVWSIGENRLAQTLAGHDGPVRQVAFSPDGSRVVTASEDGTARVWEVATGKTVHVLQGHEAAVNDASFDPTGTRIVTAGRDKTVRVWDAISGSCVRTLLGHNNSVTRACFSPDGELVLGTSADFTARVWDTNTGECRHVLRGHGHVVMDGGFSPNGSRIVTCSMDGTVRLWDPSNGRQILAIGGHSGGMISVRFTRDGTRLFMGSTEGKAWLLDSLSGRERRARSQ